MAIDRRRFFGRTPSSVHRGNDYPFESSCGESSVWVCLRNAGSVALVRVVRPAAAFLLLGRLLGLLDALRLSKTTPSPTGRSANSKADPPPGTRRTSSETVESFAARQPKCVTTATRDCNRTNVTRRHGNTIGPFVLRSLSVRYPFAILLFPFVVRPATHLLA